MSTPGQGSVLGSPIIYAKVDYGPTIGQVYRPVNQRRVVTAAGDDTIQPFDQMVIYKKTMAETFNVYLPDLDLWMRQPYGGFELVIKDGSGNASIYPIAIIPFGTQLIDGLSVLTLSGGAWHLQGDNASLIFVPRIDRLGWDLL